MAEVILAEMSAGHGVTKLAALKRIWPELAAEPDFVAMFLREARISARMNHPNVVQTYEVLDDTDRPTIAMEYLDGQPLTRVMDRLSRKGGLTLTLRLRIFANVLGALDYAHELTDYDGTLRGVVHRDVNPHNVFITYDGRVKLLDFGLAKSLSATYQTRPGNVGGRLAYMAPEQLRGGPIDRRADVFSAGVLLWELASGRRLWHGATESTIIRDLTSGAPIRPLPPDGNLPIGLDKICARALAIDPEARFATAAEFQAEIERFLPGCDDSHGRHLGKIVALAFAEERATRRSLIEGHVRANHRAIETDMSERGTRGDGTRSARNAGVWAEDDGTLATGVTLPIDPQSIVSIEPLVETVKASEKQRELDSLPATTTYVRPKPPHPMKWVSLGFMAAVVVIAGAAGLNSVLRDKAAKTPLASEVTAPAGVAAAEVAPDPPAGAMLSLPQPSPPLSLSASPLGSSPWPTLSDPATAPPVPGSAESKDDASGRQSLHGNPRGRVTVGRFVHRRSRYEVPPQDEAAGWQDGVSQRELVTLQAEASPPIEAPARNRQRRRGPGDDVLPPSVERAPEEPGAEVTVTTTPTAIVLSRVPRAPWTSPRSANAASIATTSRSTRGPRPIDTDDPFAP